MADLSFSTDDFSKIQRLSLLTAPNSENLTPFIDTSLLDNLISLTIYDDYGVTDIKLPNNKSQLRGFTITAAQSGASNISLDFTGYGNLELITVSNNPNITFQIPDELASNSGNDYPFLYNIKSINSNIQWTLPSDKQLPNNLEYVEVTGSSGLVDGPLPTDLPSNMTDWRIIGNQHTITGQPPASFSNGDLVIYRVFGTSCNFDGTDFITEPTSILRWYQVANESGNIGTHSGEIPEFSDASQLVVFNQMGCKLVGTKGASFPTNMHTKCPNLRIFKIGGRGSISDYHGQLGSFTVPRFGSNMETLLMTNLRNGTASPLISGFANDCFDDSASWQVIDLRYNNMTQSTVDILIDRLQDLNLSNTAPTVKLEGNNHPSIDDPNQTTFDITRRTAGDEGADTGNFKINTMLDAGISFTANTSGTYSWVN